MAKDVAICQWVTLRDALTSFVGNSVKHQSAGHIKPLHWYVASRLVLEGGFLPEDITPRPPFAVNRKGGRFVLSHAPSLAGGGERAVLGGLKTKNVDVTVCKDGIGPVMAVSMKGTLNAFRNLTNRMEEAVGDCTNLHIAYPALVYGFLQVMRATREAPGLPANDVAIAGGGEVVDSIVRYHDVLVRLAGRDDVRAEATKYEAVALALVNVDEVALGEKLDSFPSANSPLLLEGFFSRLYEQYDQRFVFAAPALSSSTRRVEWSADSPVFQDPRAAEFNPRISH